MIYIYGMKMRGFSIGCQPSGVVKHKDSDKLKTGFWSIIYYDRPLTDEEIKKYELQFISEVRNYNE